MLSRDRWIIGYALKEIGFDLMYSHAIQEDNQEILKGYISIIIRQCEVKKLPWVIETLIKSCVITRPEFYKISSKIRG